jgi:hypothetical protein
MASSSPGGTGVASVIAGLAVAAAAVVPLIWYTSTGPESAAPEPVATKVLSTVPEVSVTETRVITPDPVEVEALPESVVRALEAAGNVRAESARDLELPTSVVNVLADHDVVLRIAEPNADEESP